MPIVDLKKGVLEGGGEVVQEEGDEVVQQGEEEEAEVEEQVLHKLLLLYYIRYKEFLAVSIKCCLLVHSMHPQLLVT